MKKLVLAVLVLALALSGCETLKGAKKDLRKAGKNVSEAIKQ